MPRKLTVVVSQGQSQNPAKRSLEEEIVAALLFEQGLEVTVLPNLYDLAPDGTGVLCLQGISGDMVVLSWLYPRAAHWVLDRHGIRGQVGHTLLVDPSQDDDEDGEDGAGEDGADKHAPAGTDDPAASPSAHRTAAVPNRRIYCLDLRVSSKPADYVTEIRRIAAEAAVQTVELAARLASQPAAPTNGEQVKASPDAATAALAPLPIVHRIAETPDRRWYPVIDFSRCTNCLECLDFCLFGVYGVDLAQQILVEQPDNCRKGCPACSRVCPEHAIIFPQHKTPAIAGAPEGQAGGLKIDLSRLFGAPDGVATAVAERDEQLVLAGRDAVGMSVGIPKRQADKPAQPKDELDQLMDQLDILGL
jgi:hypothetical protein